MLTDGDKKLIDNWKESHRDTSGKIPEAIHALAAYKESLLNLKESRHTVATDEPCVDQKTIRPQ